MCIISIGDFMIKKLKIYLPSEIDESIKHNNAFVLRDGSFILAKGYTGCNPSHQLESSALTISRNLMDEDMVKIYEAYLKERNLNKLYYLRSMLVHYFGMGLFARVEHIKSFDDRGRFSDYSMIPNPKYYSMVATSEQLDTMAKLFELNDDGTLLSDSSDTLEKVFMLKQLYDNWHREF